MLYANKDLDAKAIVSHAASSETGMPGTLLMGLIEDKTGPLQCLARWKGLTDLENSLEPLWKVFEKLPSSHAPSRSQGYSMHFSKNVT